MKNQAVRAPATLAASRRTGPKESFSAAKWKVAHRHRCCTWRACRSSAERAERHRHRMPSGVATWHRTGPPAPTPRRPHASPAPSFPRGAQEALRVGSGGAAFRRAACTGCAWAGVCSDRDTRRLTKTSATLKVRRGLATRGCRSCSLCPCPLARRPRRKVRASVGVRDVRTRTAARSVPGAVPRTTPDRGRCATSPPTRSTRPIPLDATRH